jgi:hypothetical protein
MTTVAEIAENLCVDVGTVIKAIPDALSILARIALAQGCVPPPQMIVELNGDTSTDDIAVMLGLDPQTEIVLIRIVRAVAKIAPIPSHFQLEPDPLADV